jgi:hypothetical protein
MARIASAVTISLGVAMLLPATAGAAPAPIGLGAASSFAVLAGSAITNTGTSIINGDIGSYPTPTETGVASMVLTGTDHAGDAVTQQAKTNLTTAYNLAAGAKPPTLVATELGGTTLTPGIYNGATLQITGILTLNTLGDPNAVFIFQTASTLVTASNSSVVVLGGGLACNVFWQIGSSATLGTRSHLVGTVMASMSITATTRATVQGRLLAMDGAVTLDTNTISNAGCAAVAPTTTTTAAPTTTTAAPTTTTAAPTTTTAAPTTTTAVPTTTTTAAPTSTTSTTAAPIPTTPTTATPTPTTPTSVIIPPTGGPSTPTTVVAAVAPPSTAGVPGTPPTGEQTAAPTPEIAGPTVPNGTDLTSGTPTTTAPAITTGVTQRPALPFTGTDPRLPLAGGLTLSLGILLLGLSKRLDPSR